MVIPQHSGFEHNRVDPSFVHRFGSQQSRDFLAYLDESGGVIDERYPILAPYLTLYKHFPATCGVPPILNVGMKSAQYELFGKDWALQRQTRNTPTDLKHLASSAYQRAYLGERVIDECEAVIETLEGPKFIRWFRIIDTIQNDKGDKFLSFFGEILNRSVQ